MALNFLMIQETEKDVTFLHHKPFVINTISKSNCVIGFVGFFCVCDDSKVAQAGEFKASIVLPPSINN
ncbi:MAG: hypothetical protein ACPGJS_14750, partial [Flammeovirgaceae bacterium]